MSDKPDKTTPEDRLARLKRLKQKKAQAEKLNRDDLFQDYRDQKTRSIDKAQILKRKEKALQQQEDLDSGDSKESNRKANLNYTLQQWEDWNKSRKNKNRDDDVNPDHLAFLSYKREIDSLDVNKEDYDQQKKTIMNKLGITDEKDLVFQAVAIDTSKEAKEKLAKSLQEANERRLKKPRSDQEGSSYINDKNRQFNLKLDRQYDKN